MVSVTVAVSVLVAPFDPPGCGRSSVLLYRLTRMMFACRLCFFAPAEVVGIPPASNMTVPPQISRFAPGHGVLQDPSG